MEETEFVPLQLKRQIYSVRGHNVMLDSDLAELYGVETRLLNQAVKRNSSRFPADFMFQLNQQEDAVLRSQFVIANPERQAALLAICFH